MKRPFPVSVSRRRSQLRSDACSRCGTTTAGQASTWTCRDRRSVSPGPGAGHVVGGRPYNSQRVLVGGDMLGVGLCNPWGRDVGADLWLPPLRDCRVLLCAVWARRGVGWHNGGRPTSPRTSGRTWEPKACIAYTGRTGLVLGKMTVSEALICTNSVGTSSKASIARNRPHRGDLRRRALGAQRRVVVGGQPGRPPGHGGPGRRAPGGARCCVPAPPRRCRVSAVKGKCRGAYTTTCRSRRVDAHSSGPAPFVMARWSLSR